MTCSVLAVCTSPKKGERKIPVAAVELVADHGITGDAHAGDGQQIAEDGLTVFTQVLLPILLMFGAGWMLDRKWNVDLATVVKLTNDILNVPPTRASIWCTLAVKPCGGNHLAIASASTKAR